MISSFKVEAILSLAFFVNFYSFFSALAKSPSSTFSVLSTLLCHSKLSVNPSFLKVRGIWGMETTHLSCLPLVCLLLAGVWVLATQFSFAHLLKGAGEKPVAFVCSRRKETFRWNWRVFGQVPKVGVWRGKAGNTLSLHSVFLLHTMLIMQAIQSSVQWIIFRCTN